MRIRTWTLAGVLTASLAGSAAAQGDPAAGKALYAPCAACHGADARGNKELNAPDLTLQGDWYIVRQLKNFKEGIRGGPNDPFGSQMAPMAKVLPDEKAMKDVAAYIASLRG